MLGPVKSHTEEVCLPPSFSLDEKGPTGWLSSPLSDTGPSRRLRPAEGTQGSDGRREAAPGKAAL